MKKASIDIGTNTVLMLLVELDENSKILFEKNYYKMPRIGAEVKSTGFISDEKQKILKDILIEYKNIANDFGCEIILINATNAFRIANNSEDVTRYILNETGLEIKTIYGETEAAYSYKGSISNSDNKYNCVLDIGGGSTEIIFGIENEIEFKVSLQLGAVSLFEEFNLQCPCKDENIAMAKDHIRGLFDNLNLNVEKKLYNITAVAGTPTTLACVDQNVSEYKDELVNGYNLKLKNISKVNETLKSLSPKEIKQNYGNVVEGREDILLAGSIILEEFLHWMNKSNLTVSNRGLRYGAVFY